MGFKRQTIAPLLAALLLAGCGGGERPGVQNTTPTTTYEWSYVDVKAPDFNPDQYPLAYQGANPKEPNGAFAPKGGKIQVTASPIQQYAFFYVEPEVQQNGMTSLGRLFYGFNNLQSQKFRTAAFFSGNLSGQHQVKQVITDLKGQEVAAGEEGTIQGPGTLTGTAMHVAEWTNLAFPTEGTHLLRVFLDGRESLTVPFDVGASSNSAADPERFVVLIDSLNDNSGFPKLVGLHEGLQASGFPFQAEFQSLVGLGAYDGKRHVAALNLVDENGKAISGTKAATVLGRVRDLVNWKVTFPKAGTYYTHLAVDGQTVLLVPFVVQ